MTETKQTSLASTRPISRSGLRTQKSSDITWNRANEPAPYRLIANIQGMEKSGKDHTALTMAGPIYILSFDVGIEGVVEKFQQTKEIYYEDFGVDVPSGASADAVADEANKVWKRFTDYFRDAIRTGNTIVDTGSEQWELLRLARFGKLTQVMPHHYGPVNTEMRKVIRESFNYPHSCAFLHKMKDEWQNYTDSTGKEKGRKTGAKSFVGFSDMPFLVQANIQTWVDPSDNTHHCTFLDCRQNGLIRGHDIDTTGEMNIWATLGMTVFPDSSPEDWGLQI